MFLPASQVLRTTGSISSTSATGCEATPAGMMTPATPSSRLAGSSFTFSTECPISSKAFSADSVAAVTWGSTLLSALSRIAARRSFFGRLPTAALNGSLAGGAQYGSPTTGPAIASRNSATSRTDLAIGPLVANPAHASPDTGENDTRPREGFRPTAPQQLEGIRIEPPPSLPSASGLSPATVAHAAPPLDPPAVCSRFHGLRAGGHSPPSVVGRPPNSGVAVLPSRTPPALRMRTVTSPSSGGI